MKFSINSVEIDIRKDNGIYTLGGMSSTGKSYLASLLKSARVFGIKACVIDSIGQEDTLQDSDEIIFVDRYDFVKSQSLLDMLLTRDAIILVDCKHDCELSKLAKNARIILEKDRVIIM